jgi:hypothetical protein
VKAERRDHVVRVPGHQMMVRHMQPHRAVFRHDRADLFSGELAARLDRHFRIGPEAAPGASIAACSLSTSAGQGKSIDSVA